MSPKTQNAHFLDNGSDDFNEISVPFGVSLHE
jgi:hypothetical protein